MRRLLIAALVVSQSLATTAPGLAATLDEQPATTQQSRGAFAGARLRIPLGGEKLTPRAGLAFTAIQRSADGDGRSSLRFSEGVEFGFAGSARPQLMLAGRPIGARGLGVAQDGDEDKDRGPSTLGVIAIVAGGILVVGGIGLAVLAHEISKNSE